MELVTADLKASFGQSSGGGGTAIEALREKVTTTVA